ncbi:MAG: helix-turn-helix domain-containing protein [Aigarchaeota archaeon]|nr:helix-turn-helix domain-containing protein [Candidatus Caldarchaeales archaeon]
MGQEEKIDLVNGSKSLEPKDEKLLFYSLLKNPVRRQIITLLKENGSMAASDLKKLLGISVGTLYYHLEFMQPFVVKTDKRRYRLSEKGLRLVDSMKVSDFLAETSVSEPAGFRKYVYAFTLNPLLQRVQLTNTTLVPVSLASAMVYLLLSWRLSNSQLILHFRPVGFPELALLYAAGNLVFLIVLMLVAGFLTTFKKGGEALIAATVPLALTPSNLLLTVFAVLSGLGLLGNGWFGIVSFGVYVFFHVWQMAALAAVLVSAKGVSWEKAVAAVVALSYISLFLSQNL